ncbi:MAG: GMC family oxidoreductase [Planctomycetes bacterium]|nr:GMC family oxidoreductase [Planctomycetota bacterium]MCB9888744.1 GMC family oxidoreductase [Planctomycetota bacterium]
MSLHLVGFEVAMSDRGAADFCIVGAGLSGALLAYRLGRAGARVLLLDSGPGYDQAAVVERFHRQKSRDLMDVWRLPDTHPSPPDIDVAAPLPYPLSNIELKGFGGSTLAWLGNALRMPPWDFELHSRHGLGRDWPLSYAELAPFYADAEVELGVAGGARGPFDERDGIAPPLPPFEDTDVESRFRNALDVLGVGHAPMPQARNPRAFGGRPRCADSASCIPSCPTGAKYTALHHLALARDTGCVEVRADCHVRRIRAEGRQAVTLQCWHRGSAVSLPVRQVVLCAHTVASTRLLLASAGPDHPLGLGNASGVLGRYFMDHPTVVVDGRPAAPRGPHGFQRLVTADFCNRPERSRCGSYLVGYSFVPEFTWQNEAADPSDPEAYCYRAVANIDMLPQHGNRLSLSPDRVDRLGDPLPRLDFAFGDYERAGIHDAIAQLKRILAAMGLDRLSVYGPVFGFAPHPAGTIRMGRDPADSVVDPQLKMHELDNLHVVGSSVFPTMGPVNPSLTIAALALRLSAHLLDESVNR